MFNRKQFNLMYFNRTGQVKTLSPGSVAGVVFYKLRSLEPPLKAVISITKTIADITSSRLSKVRLF